MPRKTLVHEKPLESPKILKLKELEKLRVEAHAINKVLSSKEWKDYAQPIMDKMISDTIGSKLSDGTYSHGIVGENRYDKEYLFCRM